MGRIDVLLYARIKSFFPMNNMIANRRQFLFLFSLDWFWFFWVRWKFQVFLRVIPIFASDIYVYIYIQMSWRDFFFCIIFVFLYSIFFWLSASNQNSDLLDLTDFKFGDYVFSLWRKTSTATTQVNCFTIFFNF